MSKYHVKVDNKQEYEFDSHGLDLAALETARALGGQCKEIEVTNDLGCTIAYHGCSLQDGFLHFHHRERKDGR